MTGMLETKTKNGGEMNTCALEGYAAPASLVAPSCYSCSEATKIRWYVMSEEMVSVIMTNGTYSWSFGTHIFHNS